MPHNYIVRNHILIKLRHGVIVLFVLIVTAVIFTNVYAQQIDVLPSPLKQTKSGVLLQDIQCKKGFVILVRPTNPSPACVEQSHTTRLLANGWITLDKLSTPILPAPTGYLGGYFISSGTNFILYTYGKSSDFSAPIIPQTSSSGFFSFLFSSSKYPQSSLSVSYQSCSRSFVAAGPGTVTNENVTISSADLGDANHTNTVPASSGGKIISGVHQTCTGQKPLDFTYNKNSQDQYAVTTKSVTIPCGNVQTYDNQLLPTNYDLVKFSVRTFASAVPYSYNYLLYAHC